MRDTKERLSLFWLFALLNYLYADVFALFDIVGSQDPAPHFPQSAMLAFAALMEIPIAMIPASRLLPFRANQLANIIAGAIETLAVILMQFVVPLANGAWHEHMFALYMFFGTIETVCTSVIIWQAWTWSVDAAVSSEPPPTGSWDHFFLTNRVAQKCTRTIRVFGAHRADRDRQGR